MAGLTEAQTVQAAATLARADYLMARAHRVCGAWFVQLILRDSDSPSGKRGAGPMLPDCEALSALFRAHGRTSPLSPTEGL